MKTVRVALGLIQGRGSRTLPASLVDFGPDESDFLVRHVASVRAVKDVSSRSLFASGSGVPQMVSELLSCDGPKFEQLSRALQERLARAMTSTTNATDCVFAIVTTGTETAEHTTILKLDAVVEAARTSIAEGKVSLHVLKELIPEPGRLQKALSWPDPRTNSDVLMIDTNASAAQYFETAFDVHVSPRSKEAERRLHAALVDNVPLSDLPAAFAAASAMSGPMDTVINDLATTFPTLQTAYEETQHDPEPTGIVRANKVTVLPLVWQADGATFSVPPSRASSVEIEQLPDGNGWRFSFVSTTKPTLGQ